MPVPLVVLVAPRGVVTPRPERRHLARLRIADHRAVQIVAVRRELDEAALLHLASLRPGQHRLTPRPSTALHPPAGNGDDRGHPRGEQQRVDPCVIARVRVVDRDEDRVLAEGRFTAARTIDVVERDRVPAVRDEVLEEGHEVRRGHAVRVEAGSLVHNVVQHDREECRFARRSGRGTPPGYRRDHERRDDERQQARQSHGKRCPRLIHTRKSSTGSPSYTLRA